MVPAKRRVCFTSRIIVSSFFSLRTRRFEGAGAADGAAAAAVAAVAAVGWAAVLAVSPPFVWALLLRFWHTA